MDKNKRYIARSGPAPSITGDEQHFHYQNKNIMILSDRLGGAITAELTRKLKAASCEVVVVSNETIDYAFECKKIVKSIGQVHVILNLCGLAGKMDFTTMSSDEWKKELEHVFDVTFNSLQSVYYEWKENAEECAFLTVSNMGANFGMENGSEENAASGILTGFVKAMAREIEWLFCKAIDLDGNLNDVSYITKCILDELEIMSPLLEVSYAREDSSSIRTTIDVVPQQIIKKQTTLSLTAEDTILFVGGGRGILTVFIDRLLDCFPTKILIVGRTSIPKEKEWVKMSDTQFRAYKAQYIREKKQKNQDMAVIDIIHSYEKMEKQRQLAITLKRLKEKSDQVFYMECDISNTNAVIELEKKIKEQFGTITGIVNGAGIITVGSLGKKAAATALDGIMVRGMGIYNLYHAFQEYPLKFWQNVGSVAGRFGMDGQCDYVASCDLATKMCRKINRTQNHFHCYSIEWTAWEDIGMAALPDVRQVQERRGLTYISVAEGKEKFIDELFFGEEEEVLIFGDLGEGMTNSYPLIDQVLYQDQESLSVARKMDIKKDLFLREHKVEGNYVFPAVAHLELYCEMAALFAKAKNQKWYIKEIRKIELKNFVKYFEKNELVLVGHMVFTKEKNHMIARGKITSDFQNGKGQVLIKDREHSEIELVLTDKELEIKQNPFELQMDSGKDLDLERFYWQTDRYLHFGELYRHINWVRQLTDNSFIGEVVAQADSRILSGSKKSRTSCFPIALDTVGRVALVGIFEKYRAVAVPVMISNVKVHQCFHEGETIYSYVEILGKKDKTIQIRQLIINRKQDILYELLTDLYILCDNILMTER